MLTSKHVEWAFKTWVQVVKEQKMKQGNMTSPYRRIKEGSSTTALEKKPQITWMER